jgi:hypothetical protein
MNQTIPCIKCLICLSLLVLSFAKASSQVNYYTVYDHHDKKIIDLNKFSTDDLLDRAANHHMWEAFETSDSIYGYLMAKDLFTINPEDTVHIGEYSTYINLAHLRILKNKYKEAQCFLALSEKSEEPQHFCGNAYEARFTQKKSYELLCQLALSKPSTSKKTFEELLNMAFEISHLEYGGEALVHYLTYWYGKTGALKIISNTQSTITATKKEEDGYALIDVKTQMLGSPLTFRIYCDENVGNDPTVIKKMAVDYFKFSFDGWRNIK